MRFLWGALCRKAIVEERSGKLSIIDIPEVMVLNEPGPVYPNPEGKIGLTFGFTYVAVFWYDEDNGPEIQVRLLWRTPDGETLLGNHEAPARSGAKNTSVRFLLEIEKVEFRGLGLYELELQMRDGKKRRWQKVASYPLVLKVIDSASISLEPLSGPTLSSPPASSSQP